LGKNLHITILSLFGGETIFEVFLSNVITPSNSDLNVTHGQTDGQYTVASPRGKIGRQNIADTYHYILS